MQELDSPAQTPEGDGKGHWWVHFYIFIARLANLITKDGRPCLAIKLKREEKKKIVTIFHFLLRSVYLFIYLPIHHTCHEDPPPHFFVSSVFYLTSVCLV